MNDLSFDILYGLPLQTIDSFTKTLEQVVALSPDRVSVFGYAHLPIHFKRQSKVVASDLPNAEVRFLLAEQADARLLGTGYRRIGFDHYAKPDNPLAQADARGRLRRNFQGFADDPATTVLGVGASAISFVDGLYAQNEKSVGEYMDQVRRGASPVVRGLQRTKLENAVADAIGELLCRMQADIGPVLKSVQPQEALRICASLERFEADGVLAWRGDEVKMTPGAHFLARAVAASLDGYVQAPSELAVTV